MMNSKMRLISLSKENLSGLTSTIQPVLVAICIKQATCLKQAVIQIPKKANESKFTCFKQANFADPLGACLIHVHDRL